MTLQLQHEGRARVGGGVYACSSIFFRVRLQMMLYAKVDVKLMATRAYPNKRQYTISAASAVPLEPARVDVSAAAAASPAAYKLAPCTRGSLGGEGGRDWKGARLTCTMASRPPSLPMLMLWPWGTQDSMSDGGIGEMRCMEHRVECVMR